MEYMVSVIYGECSEKLNTTCIDCTFRNQLCATIIDVKLSFDLIIAMD